MKFILKQKFNCDKTQYTVRIHINDNSNNKKLVSDKHKLRFHKKILNQFRISKSQIALQDSYNE